MTEPMQPRHIPRAELELIHGPVTNDGGELRVLHGADYGLDISVMHSTVVAGSGARRHRHPHAEVFVIGDGRAATRWKAPRSTRPPAISSSCRPTPGTASRTPAPRSYA
jgi:hypothetical protein